MHAIVSIHDVEPSSLALVQSLIDGLPHACRSHLILLVIPAARPWKTREIDQLKQWQQQGFALAGHGWRHHCKRILGGYHQLHSRVISRAAAEHLALNQEQIATLLTQNYHWFIEHGLTPASTYVPPAWAMGRISANALRRSGFRYFEYNWGIRDVKQNVLKRLPVVGFEADSRPRQIALSAWNAVNSALATTNRPLRLSIHPRDPQLRLKHSLARSLNQVTCGRSIESLFCDMTQQAT